MQTKTLLLSLVLGLALVACGGSEADELGVGSQCTANDECNTDDSQECLTEFKGGYCGVRDCISDVDCPEDAACIANVGGGNFCFRTCANKVDCNANRDVENESNCSSSVTFTDGDNGRKACVPPSSGT